MQINIKYFGKIAEQTHKTEEIIDISSIGEDLASLRSFCFQKYQIKDDKSVQLAVNQAIIKDTILQAGDEVVFLPPFSGG